MQLLLIRHSITAGNLEHRYIGCRTDEPLCEAGIALAQQKSVEFRRSFPAPELVLVSPMQRCRQTAEILFPHMPQKIVWGLQECDFGAFEGKNYQELSGDTSYQAWIDSGGTIAFPNGESREEFIQRCCKGMSEVLLQSKAYFNRNDNELLQSEKGSHTIGLVVHGGTIMALCSAFGGGEYFDYQVANGAGYSCNVNLDGEEIRFQSIQKIEMKTVHLFRGLH